MVMLYDTHCMVCGPQTSMYPFPDSVCGMCVCVHMFVCLYKCIHTLLTELSHMGLFLHNFLFGLGGQPPLPLLPDVLNQTQVVHGVIHSIS